MTSKPYSSEIGIGATDELSLRVSVAVLVRVLFEDPDDRDLMLALERRATLHKISTGQVVEVKSQPFGGALRIHKLEPLQNLIGDFHFDSAESRLEQDFRIFIRPSTWETLRTFCVAHLTQANDSVLESDPTRELAEEIDDTLGISLKRDQYVFHAVGTLVEDEPSATENVSARGYPTARIYRIFEAHILDPSLISALLGNSETCSDHAIRERALDHSQNGRPGRVNAVLTLPFKELTAFYLATPLEARNIPSWFQDHQLDETVAAVLEDVSVPKYRIS
jgi:hypothetical protein